MPLSPLMDCLYLKKKYITDLLTKTHMLDAKEVITPLSPTDTLKLHDGSAKTDPTQFRQVLGSL